jgi:hypothetical protein
MPLVKRQARLARRARQARIVKFTLPARLAFLASLARIARYALFADDAGAGRLHLENLHGVVHALGRVVEDEAGIGDVGIE